MYPHAEAEIKAARATDIGRQAWAAFEEEGKFLVPPFCLYSPATGNPTYHRFSMVRSLTRRVEV